MLNFVRISIKIFREIDIIIRASYILENYKKILDNKLIINFYAKICYNSYKSIIIYINSIINYKKNLSKDFLSIKIIQE